MIVKKDNKWLVMDSSGKKVLGTHYSKEEANDQLAAIEISKKRKSKVEESQNLLNNSMTNLTEYYKKLCEDLKIQRMVLEAKVKEEKEKKHKKGKKADKDYDGDGKVESGSEEYLGSRSNAIKKAVSKREGKELKEYTTRMQDLKEINMGSESNRRAWEEQKRRNDEEYMKTGINRYLPGKNEYHQSIRDVIDSRRASEPRWPRPVGAGRDLSMRVGIWKEPPNMERELTQEEKIRLDQLNQDFARRAKEAEGRKKFPIDYGDLDAMRQKGEEIGGVPAPKPEDDIMSMRRKAAEMGGITDDMVNEPLPGSSSLPGMDLTAQTPEQIDAANRGQTGVFGRPTTTGIARQPKSMSNLPTASPEAKARKMMPPDPASAGAGPRIGSAPRKPSSGPTKFDLAQSVLNYVTGREAPKEGKVRDATGKLVDRNTLSTSMSKSKPSMYADLIGKAKRKVPGMNLYASMQEETNFKINMDRSLVESTLQRLSENKNSIDHLTHENNTKIQLSENVIFGGFPQIKKA